MAGLNPFWEQILIEGTIYEIQRSSNNFESRVPMIHIRGTGSIDVLGAQETPASVADMTLQTTDENVPEGYKAFDVIPRYLLVRANQAGTRTIVLSGFVVPALAI